MPDVRARRVAGAKLPVSALDSTRTQVLDEGEFLTLDNQIDVQTGTIKAKARFANAKGTLFPNQFVNVRMLLDTIDAAVVIPVIALRHGPSGDFVYVVNADHTVTLRTVSAGVAGVEDVEITKGLALGEQVVTEGGDRLKDGARIQTPADRPADANAGDRKGGGAARASGAAPGAGNAPSTGTETARSAGRARRNGAAGAPPARPAS